MRSATQPFDREKLRINVDLEPRNRTRKSHFSELFRKLAYTAEGMFFDQSEPRIRQVRRPSGEVYWRAYDPVTRQSASFDSEAAVRSWLEQRYYA
jgi:hypothetical protein